VINMVDYQTIAYEMKEAERKIKNNFMELGALDYQRAEHFYDYFKHNRREDLERFLKKTVASRTTLQSIRRDFRKILSGMSLIEKKAYKHHNFKTLLGRARNMQNLQGDFVSHRKKQIRSCRSLLRTRNIQNTFLKKSYEYYKKGISTLQEKRLILSFGRERDLVAMFEGHYKDEKQRIDAAFQDYLNEKKQSMSTKEVPLTMIVLVPAVGAALALAVDSGVDWANHSGYNHKLTVKPAGRKYGPAI